MTVLETNSSKESLSNRKTLEMAFRNTKIPAGELMCNLGLYLRSSALVKYLVLNEIYEMILQVPGDIMEFGVWWGQNLVLFENFRAIYEPFNKNRRIIGFDTFEGYKGITVKDDLDSAIFSEGNFSTQPKYVKELEELLQVHEKTNILGHIHGNHQLVAGDCCKTVPRYFNDNPEQLVALAYLDVGLYEPTRVILENIIPNMVKGGVIVLDELNWIEAPGERIAYKKVLKNIDHEIHCSKYTKERVYIRLK